MIEEFLIGFYESFFMIEVDDHHLRPDIDSSRKGPKMMMMYNTSS